MVRKAIISGLLLFLILSTGCVGERLSATNSTAAPDTSRTISENQITSYEKLTNASQQRFQRVLSEGSITGTRSEFSAGPRETKSGLWETNYVRYNGTVYAITGEGTDDWISEWTLELPRDLDSQIDTASTVVDFEQLSPAAQDVFNETRRSGTYRTRDLLPSQLAANDYVRYQNQYYRTEITTGDIPEVKISVTELSAQSQRSD